MPTNQPSGPGGVNYYGNPSVQGTYQEYYYPEPTPDRKPQAGTAYAPYTTPSGGLQYPGSPNVYNYSPSNPPSAPSPPQPATAPRPAPQQQSSTPSIPNLSGLVPQLSAGFNMPALSTYLAMIPPINLPTEESQNQLMGLGAQKGSVGNLIKQLSGGNSGVAVGSGGSLERMAKPYIEPYAQAALSSAKLGVTDQLTRDQQMMKGLLGYANADLDLAGAAADRQGINLGAQSSLLNSITRLMGGLIEPFGVSDILGGIV